MRTWTRLALAVSLAVPFTLAPLRAADPETTASRLEKLEKDLAALSKVVDKLKDDVAAANLRGAKADTDLQEIKKLLRQIADKQEQITRQSGYGPGPEPAGPGGAPANGIGTITVQNQYTATATVRINGRSYTVEPYRTVTIGGVPLGAYNYEVEVEGYGLVQPLQTETLRPVGRRITIYPRIGG